jgi:ribosomal protein S18 acetylase RimI-like enzyme
VKILKFEFAIEKNSQYIIENDKHIVKELIDKKIRDKEIIIVKDNDNNNIGWLRYSFFWDNIPFINMLYLNKNYRGKGAGKQLVQFWENIMKSKGYSLVMTSTLSNEEAQHFYRKIGYKDSGSVLLENEPLEIIFAKKIL